MKYEDFVYNDIRGAGKGGPNNNGVSIHVQYFRVPYTCTVKPFMWTPPK